MESTALFDLPSPTQGAHRLRVAVPAPVPQAFDYASDELVQPGARVRVPFGFQGKVVGVVTEVVSADKPLPAGVKQLRAISRVLDHQALLSPDVCEMANFAARYYHAPIGEVYATALPSLLRKGEPASLTKITGWRIAGAGKEALAAGPKGNAKRRHELLTLLGNSDTLTRDDFLGLEDGWRDALNRMSRQGLVEKLELTSMGNRGQIIDPGFALTDEQQCAVDTIVGDLGRFSPTVLDGRTGTGKTEVYIRAAQAALKQGLGVLILVPEIGLTPQTVNRLRTRLDSEVLVLHSGLTDKERTDAWLRAQKGKAGVVVGTRSAVWTPIPNLGLIVVDEEHDRSFKQTDSGVRYNARDLAIWRAGHLEIPIVLGSATPSMEIFRNAQDGKYRKAALTQRTGSAGMPDITIVDMAGIKSQPLHPKSIECIQDSIDQGEQALVYLNRRGWAPVMMCSECGEPHECYSCDHPMVYHRSRSTVLCHWCGDKERAPQRCRACGNPKMIEVGHGTERIDQALEKLFPDTSVVRIDSDTVRSRGAMEEKLRPAHEGKPCILVGTQMLTKGHDLPMLTTVVVLDIDGALFSTELRSQEQLAQTLVQVSGRAGRGDRSGNVIVQSRVATHGMLHSILFRGYHAALADMLEERKCAQMPPFTHMAVLRFNSPDARDCDRFGLLMRNGPKSPDSVMVSGPVAGSRPKVAGRFQFYFVIESQDRNALHRHLNHLQGYLAGAKPGKNIRWALDIDPYSLSA